MNPGYFHELLGGARRGWWPAFLRGCLACGEPVYRLAVGLRNARFDRVPARATRVPCPVISVGNLTTGGTGKTPCVLWLAAELRARGRHPVVLSRGYKSLDGQENDEARELRARAPNLPHLQGADRVALARQALDQQLGDVLILDDGFQHRRLARDLDLVLLDATLPFGYGHLLPRGLLREPLSGLRRAGGVIINRADQVPPETLAAIVGEVHVHAPGIPCAAARQHPELLVNAVGNQLPLTALANRAWFGFAAIGNPANFRATLESLGCQLRGFQAFPDHCAFTAAERNQLVSQARRVGAAQLVCTGKDLVKFAARDLDGLPLWAVRSSLHLLEGAAEIQARVAAAVNGVQMYTCSTAIT